MKKLIIFIFLLANLITNAQQPSNGLTISGYAEAYYGYDLNTPMDNYRPGFVYSHNRHNEFNLNLGYIKLNYTRERVRADIALAAGTYMNTNYAAEPGVLKNVYEARVGVKLSKKKNLWLDAGIMPSHIGFESAISKDCWTLTRSVLADNSPYYEAGAKLTYTTDNGRWMFSALALNGWQRIQRVNGNSLISWGGQVQYKPSDKVLLNYSNFIGTDKPDSARQLRVFHNLYGIFTLSDKWGITAGFDIGTEQKTSGNKNLNTWYSPVLIVKYNFSETWAMVARAEYYSDKNGVIIATGTANGFKTTGVSLNIDHSPAKNVLVRLEAKTLRSKDPIFQTNTNPASSNTVITSSIAVSF